MRLIDADRLPHKDLSDGERMCMVVFSSDIASAPTIDAVEVVRCEDCKYFDGECCDRYADETLGYSHSTQPNFFCAVGERKTDDS